MDADKFVPDHRYASGSGYGIAAISAGMVWRINHRQTSCGNERRGDPHEEIRKRVSEGKKHVFYSDVVQYAAMAKLVQINTLKAHGAAVNEVGL